MTTESFTSENVAPEIRTITLREAVKRQKDRQMAVPKRWSVEGIRKSIRPASDYDSSEELFLRKQVIQLLAEVAKREAEIDQLRVALRTIWFHSHDDNEHMAAVCQEFECVTIRAALTRP